MKEIPKEIINAASQVAGFFKSQMIDEWELMGICSRNLSVSQLDNPDLNKNDEKPWLADILRDAKESKKRYDAQIKGENAVVNYWDDDSGKMETKKCIQINYDSKDSSRLEFMPVDNPVRIYKSVVITHPVVKIVSDNNKCNIIVDGFRSINGEYNLVTTTFTIR
mgnify:CR=1 FL=1